MQLTARLVLTIMLAISLLTAGYAYISVQREEQRLRMQIRSEAQSLGRALEKRVVLSWQQNGGGGSFRLAQEISVNFEDLGARVVTPSYLREMLDSADTEVLDMQDDETLSIVQQASDGWSYLRTYHPVQIDSRLQVYLEFTKSLRDVEEYKRATIVRTLALLGAILACGAVVAFAGVRLVGRPLERLIDKTERIGDGDFSTPLELPGYAELSELADALNRMCQQLAESQQRLESETAGRLATLEQLRHADRLKTVGRLASGVAHELGTPLSVVSGRAELIGSGQLSDEQIRESAQAVKHEADRMAGIIRQLLDFARRSSPQRTTVDVRPVIQRSLELMKPLARKRSVDLQFVAEERPYPALVDAGQIQQVVTNLIDNAIDSQPEGPPVRLELAEQTVESPPDSDDKSGNYCVVSVIDHGAGIAKQDLPHIFEPFFTTKRLGEGTGLGLSVSYGIVEDHGGWIEVDSQPGRGSSFRVYLPQETQ